MEESESSLGDGSEDFSFQCLRHFFFLLHFFFFALESDEDVSDDESEDYGSGSGFTSGSCLSPFLNYPLILLVYCHVMYVVFYC